MKMEILEEGAVTRVRLTGRLDTPGVDSIETRFTASVVPTSARAIVDMSGVEFIGSLGLRMFITVARALNRRNGRMVLYAPQPFVAQVLETSALGELIPVCTDEASALATASP